MKVMIMIAKSHFKDIITLCFSATNQRSAFVGLQPDVCEQRV
jgi:hypothetical protein